MTTLAAPNVNEFPADSLEKKVYSMVNELDNYLPLMNDRNRLSFALLNYLRDEGDSPLITVRNNKLTLENISRDDFVKLLEEKLKGIQK